MDSFRCIHASHLRLDCQLQGVGPVGDDLREVIEEATFAAFERMIELCLTQQVDCLLISGDCFDGEPSGRSSGGEPLEATVGARREEFAQNRGATIGLRGPAAFVRGIARLQETDTRVIVRPGRTELWAHWPQGLRLPPNVHALGTGSIESVPISRAGKLLASITAAHPSGWLVQIPQIGEGCKALHLQRDPGSTQGLRAGESGSHGCLLVEIDSQGEMHETVLPTAPVRWERFEVTAGTETVRDDLLEEMAGLLEAAPRQACERVWLVGWEVTGAGGLFESLHVPSFRERLLAELAELEPVPGVHIHTHSMRLHETPRVPVAGSGDDLEADCLARLEGHFASGETALADCLAASALCGGPWEVRLESLLAELDAGEVAHDARRLAMRWFAGTEELSS